MAKEPKTPRSKQRALPYRPQRQVEGTPKGPIDRPLSDISGKVNSSLPCKDGTHRIHPDGFDNHHIEELKTFVHDLDRSLKHSFPAESCPYPAVYVVLIRWVEDDLGVHREITRLRRVFEGQYNFDVEEWYIPTSNSYGFLEAKMFHFKTAHQDENDLLIVYYGGHAVQDLRRGRSIWYAHLGEESPSLNWYNLQPMLLEASFHVLIILDCCFAANAARDTSFGKAKELLAACAGESETPGVCDLSFTSALVEELQYSSRTPFTVAMLFSRLVTPKSTRRKLTSTPIHVHLSEYGSDSITIAPLRKSAPDKEKGSDQGGFATSNETVPSPDENNPLYRTPPTSASSTNFPPRSPIKPETRVLLSVSVSADIGHNIAQWVHWLTTGAPWDVTKMDVKLQAIYESHSTLVLVSIPIVAWTQLPERAAYRFIGFVQSANLHDQSTYKPPMKRTIRTRRKRTHSELNDSDQSTESPTKRRQNLLPLTPPKST